MRPLCMVHGIMQGLGSVQAKAEAQMGNGLTMPQMTAMVTHQAPVLSLRPHPNLNQTVSKELQRSPYCSIVLHSLCFMWSSCRRCAVPHSGLWVA